METQNIKSRACLSSFIRYCVAHPEERFWQALRNWSEYDKIVGVTITHSPEPNPNPLMKSGYGEQHRDTFYIEGRRHDESI